MPWRCTSRAAKKCTPRCFGGGEVRRPGRADPTSTDLDHLPDVCHLRRAAHGRRQAPALALHLVAPVDVGIDLHDRDRATTGVRLQHRDRDRVVTTENHRNRSGRQHRFAGVTDRGTVGFVCRGVPRYVANIYGGGSIEQHRSVEVEVVMVANARVRRRGGADRSRCVLAIRSDRRIRRGARRTDHDDVGTLQIVDRGRRQTEKRAGITGAEHRTETCHRHSLTDRRQLRTTADDSTSRGQRSTDGSSNSSRYN